MARGVNKVMLIGNLGGDPETRFTDDGLAIARLSVATSEQRKDRNTGETITETEWHRVVFFGRLAEIVNEYLRKGSKVYVEGRLRTSKWTDKEGQTRYTTEILASEMQMLDSKGGSDGYRAPSSTSMGEDQGFSQPMDSSAAAFENDIPF